MRTEHFSIDELVYSATAIAKGIDNTPNEAALQNLELLIKQLLQPVRQKLGMPIKVNSGFRSEALNKAIGGAHRLINGQYVPTSRHCKGQAADLTCADNAALFNTIRAYFVFDQLIWEMGDNDSPQWVHVSLVKQHNRNEVLRAYKTDGGTRYEHI